MHQNLEQNESFWMRTLNARERALSAPQFLRGFVDDEYQSAPRFL